MEYGSQIDGKDEVSQDNSLRYVGWSNYPGVSDLFKQTHINNMSKRLTELLTGVDPKGRPIIIPDKTISSVKASIQQNYRPKMGDVHSKYTVAHSEVSYLDDIVNQTLQIIAQQVKDNIEMEESNKKLTVWTTVLGDFNEGGMRSHPQIKVREKRPTAMQFNMNY